MLSSSHSVGCRRGGLTLLELVVVMAILVALAAIIIPLLPGMIGRAETSARATNSGEIYKWIQTYEASYSSYPSDWDALTDGTTTPLTYVGGFTGSTPPLAITALTGPQNNALMSAGISRVQLMATTPDGTTTDDTFIPYLDTTNKASTTGATKFAKDGTPNLVTLTTVGQFQLNLADSATATSTGVYVVFGFGKRCSIVGSMVNEAPFNFFDNSALNPSTRYSRYGVVFQVNGAYPNTTTISDFSRAKLVRVFRFGGTLATGDDAIKSYWDDVSKSGGS